MEVYQYDLGAHRRREMGLPGLMCRRYTLHLLSYEVPRVNMVTLWLLFVLYSKRERCFKIFILFFFYQVDLIRL